MNSTPQLDLHPDAESLNAFIEQALGAAERAQVLSHLAGCGRCRQVVFMAQAAAEEEMPAVVAASRGARESRPWFANWRWTWVPAAALAASVALAVTFNLWTGGLRPKRTDAPPETARVVPHDALKAPASGTPMQRNTETTSAAVPSAALKPQARKAQTPVRPAQPVEAGPSASAPSIALGAGGALHGEGSTLLPAPSTPGPGGLGAGLQEPAVAGQANMVLFKPQPAANPWPQQTLQKRMPRVQARSAETTPVAQTNLRAMGGPQAASALSFVAATPQGEARPAAGNNFAVSMKRTLAAAPALAGIGGFKLPGGVRAVSAAVTPDRTLAVNPAGALFLSEDAGLHWEPVAQQWTGRAIEVRATKAAGDAAAPALAFELMNETGLAWTSADGKVWKAK
jgi:hypothetical protein